MLTAVWVAATAAAAAFVIGVAVAVYLMLKAARLLTDSSAALASLQRREDLLIERASAAIDRVGEQITKTETITANMDDVTVGMAELHGRLTALTPAAAPGADGATSALTWVAALLYGIARALGLRWAASVGASRPAPVSRPRPAAVGGSRPAAVEGRRPAPVEGQRRAALTGRRGG
jgi:hypothetical protein